MNQIANSLILAFQQAAGVSHHLLEITGLNGHFHSAADTLYAYPATTTTFRLVHFTTVVFKIRTSEGMHFSSSNPFGSLLSAIILCFAGSIIQNVLLGLPPVKPLENTSLILLVSLIWYLVFFSPWDLFTRLVIYLPIRIALVVLKECYRIKCMLSGVQLAASVFPEAWLIMIAAGSIRGCGSLVLRPFAHQIVGLGPAHIEFHRPSFTTKISILISCVFALQVKGIIDVSLATTSFMFTLLVTTFQLLFLLTAQNDPFIPLEDFLAKIFFRHPDQKADTGTNESKKKSD